VGTDAGKYVYSTDGVTWSAEILPSGAASDNNASMKYLNGTYYYFNAAEPTKIYRSANIATGFSSATMNGSVSIETSGISYLLYASADILIAKTTLGLAYSRNGLDWTLFPDDLTVNYSSQVLSTAGGLIFAQATGSQVAIKDYTANNAPDTFSIPYPAEGEAPAPWQYYVRAFQ
jgi:hypothetical protein